jgi:intracellular septation protein A
MQMTAESAGVKALPAATASAVPVGPSLRMHPSKLTVVGAVVKRLVPQLIEASLIPTVLFYVFLMASGLRWAFAAALVWSYAAVGRRILGRRPIPGVLVLTTVGITMRTVVLICSGSTFMYFLQPILGTVVTGAVFGVSVLIGRPLVGRFASDFCPLSAEVESRPAVSALFRRLTYMWAGLNIAAALTSLTLLITVPVPVFVGTKTVAVWVITCIGLVVTVSAAVTTARAEGLETAIGADGTLHAYVATRPV